MPCVHSLYICLVGGGEPWSSVGVHDSILVGVGSVCRVRMSSWSPKWRSWDEDIRVLVAEYIFLEVVLMPVILGSGNLKVLFFGLVEVSIGVADFWFRISVEFITDGVDISFGSDRFTVIVAEFSISAVGLSMCIDVSLFADIKRDLLMGLPSPWLCKEEAEDAVNCVDRDMLLFL